MPAAFDLELKVVDNLRAYYKINEAAAKDIFDETMVLYHRLYTITDFNELNKVNNRILFTLIIVIGHYYDSTESTRFLFSVIMFIVITGRKADSEYMFMQWLSASAQGENIDNGLDVFIYTLKALREHFEREHIQSFENFHDLFKALNNNIILLEEEIVKEGTNEQRNTINQIKSDFNSYLCEHAITISIKMNINDLSHHVLYNISRHLSFIDVINLSKTCKQLYILIENNDYFWMTLIQNHFGSKLYQLYVKQIFQNKKNSDYVLYRTKEDIEKFEKYFRGHSEWEMCNFWLLNVLNGKDNSDGYIAHKSIVRQKRRPRTTELKMSLTTEEFFESYMNRNKYLNNENIREISMYKLIYYYFIEAKRLLGADLFAIDLRCTPHHRCCPMRKYLNHECDLNSLTGRCVRLYSIRSRDLAGIKGKFKSILPGIYEIICRIKLDKNNEYLTYYNECYSKDPKAEKSVKCYFYALADRGLDCECDWKKMNFDWFESNYLLYGNTNWFNETMGKIEVFELSNIYFGFRIKSDYGYRNILFDYLQLNIIK
ncbi:unnamed protein product [Rotaria magnacalcarata]|uniref:F-box domain-containing protein n=2 Tax=Rotaria magnacalcarata TaxID=392030 RepID=A0A819YGU0_9BILA|nr:unnamed protein product [Rotaria magnacalcarata]